MKNNLLLKPLFNTSKKNLIILLSLTTFLSLFIAVIVSKILKKDINTIAIEAVALLISSVLLITGIVSLHKKNKEIAEIKKQIKQPETINNNELEEKLRSIVSDRRILAVDTTGSAICYVMQCVTLVSAIFPQFFAQNPTLTHTYRAVDIVGVLFFVIASAMIVREKVKKEQKKINKGTIIAGVMLSAMLLSLIGKIGLEIPGFSELPLGNGLGNLIVPLLLRIIGLTVFVGAFSYMIFSKPTTTNIEKKSISPDEKPKLQEDKLLSKTETQEPDESQKKQIQKKNNVASVSKNNEPKTKEDKPITKTDQTTDDIKPSTKEINVVSSTKSNQNTKTAYRAL